MKPTNIESLFPAVRLERTDAGTRVVFQDAHDIQDSAYMLAFLNEIPQTAAEFPQPGSGIQLTLKALDQVGRFLEALLLGFLVGNCRKKALRSTALGKRLSDWQMEEALPPEVREGLTPVIRKLLPLAAGQGVALIPLRDARLGAFTFWATSSADYDGLNISEMTLVGRDAIPVLEITLNRAGDWLIEERPAVTTAEFLEELKKTKRRQESQVVTWTLVGLLVMGAVAIVLGYFEHLWDWLPDWQKLKERLKQSGHGWLAMLGSAVVAAWVAWAFLGETIREVMKLYRQMPLKLRVLLLGLLAAGLGVLIWLWSGDAELLSFQGLILLSALLGGVLTIGAWWQRRWERKLPEYRAYLVEEERSFGRSLREGTGVFMGGLSVAGWRGCSGEVKVTTQGLLFYAGEAKRGARKLFVPLGGIAHYRRTGDFLPRNQQSANLSHLETHDRQTLVFQMEPKLHRALAHLLRDSAIVARCRCGNDLRVAKGDLAREHRCPVCGQSVPLPAEGRQAVVIKGAEETARLPKQVLNS